MNVTTTTTGRPDAPGRHKGPRRVPYGPALAALAALTIGATLAAAPHAPASEPYPDDRPRRIACATATGPGPCLYDTLHRRHEHGPSYLVRANGIQRNVSHRRAHDATPNPTSEHPHESGPRHREACAHEGAPGPCLWDARHRGNGQGQSFLVRASGKVIPVSHRRAHAATRHAE